LISRILTSSTLKCMASARPGGDAAKNLKKKNFTRSPQQDRRRHKKIPDRPGRRSGICPQKCGPTRKQSRCRTYFIDQASAAAESDSVSVAPPLNHSRRRANEQTALGTDLPARGCRNTRPGAGQESAFGSAEEAAGAHGRLQQAGRQQEG